MSLTVIQTKSLVKISLLFIFFLQITLSQGQTDDNIPATIFYKDGSSATKNVSIESFFRKYEVLEQGQAKPTNANLINKVVVDSTTYFLKEDKTGHVSTWIILEKLIEGEINLYATPDQLESRLYYVEQDSVLRLLRKMTKKTEDGRLLTIDEYKTVITFFTRTCALINDRTIKNLKLNEESLKQVIIIYNNGCNLPVAPIAAPVDSSAFILKTINKESTPLLLEKLLEGKINFYAEVGKSNKNRFFAEKDTFFLELREYPRYNAAKVIMVEEFKAHLRILVLDCKGFESRLNTLTLNRKSIYNFIYSYNKECGWLKQGQEEILKSSWLTSQKMKVTNQKIEAEWSALAGYCLSHVWLLRTQSIELNRPFIGVTVSIKKNHSRYSLWNALLYEYISGKKSTSIPSNNPNTIIDWKYNIHELRNQLAVQILAYSKNQITITGRMGLSINMQISNHSTKIDKSYRSNVLVGQEIHYLKNPRVRISPFSSLGLRYKSFEIFYSFQILGRNTELDGLTNENRLMVSYYFRNNNHHQSNGL